MAARLSQELINKIKGNLIVSCQALEDEPLHSSFIMSKMALAAKMGGAAGIRANSTQDIAAIKKEVDLPIIGIIKEVYDNSPVYITPTMKEVEKLMQVGVDIIACDATCRKRPDGHSLSEFISEIREKYPDQLLMADIATLQEAKEADRLGFDFIGTTLHGYTAESQGCDIAHNDFEFLSHVLQSVRSPVIAEGKVDTPEKAKKVKNMGVFAVVVGSAISRPQLITKSFFDAMMS